MSLPRTRPRRPKRGLYDHDERYCGFEWDCSCDECRKTIWPDRYFSLPPQVRPMMPRERRPFLSQQELIRTLHHHRNKPSVRWAMMDLLLDDLVELIEERLDARGQS